MGYQDTAHIQKKVHSKDTSFKIVNSKVFASAGLVKTFKVQTFTVILGQLLKYLYCIGSYVQRRDRTRTRENLRGQKSLGPPQNVPRNGSKSYRPAKKIMSSSFLNSGTLIVIVYGIHIIKTYPD